MKVNNTHQKLLIIGAGGHGKVCAEIAYRMKIWEEIEFLDDYKDISDVLGFEVIGKLSDISAFIYSHDFFVAIGNNEQRREISEKLFKKDAYVATLIDPSANLSKYLTVGTGTVIMPGVTINASTVLGNGSIVNTMVSIDHDCSIGNFVHLSPGTTISGNVEIGDSTWIGAGTTIINNLKIAEDIIIGAGSLVLRDLKISGKYIGSPAVFTSKI